MTKPSTPSLKVPSYLCQDCSDKFPKVQVLGYGYTVFSGTCPICEKEKGLASARDYGIKSTNTENWD